MILRILRGRVVEGDEARLAAYVRDEAIGHALGMSGLVSFQPALRERDAGLEFVIVSTWRSIDDLLALGQPLDSIITMPKAAGLVRDTNADHFEVVFGEARAMPLQRAVLRITDSPLRPQAEPAYFEHARRLADKHLDVAGMVAITLARRSVGPVNHVVEVTLWEEGALEEILGTDREGVIGEDIQGKFLGGSPAVEHLNALMATDPRPGAAAILVADDAGRYIYATPAAAALTGYPLARLLTMGVSDIATSAIRPVVPDQWDRFIAAGVEVGEFDLARPDSSVASVHFAAKTNAPWPGSHSSVLTPADGPAITDVDQALSEAGLVARYGLLVVATA